MPERDKQVDAMARTIAGAGPRPFSARLGQRPDAVDEMTWTEARSQADRIYVDLVETVDFQRVLIEANKRHLTVHPEKSTLMAAADIGVYTSETLCGECVTEVMLATATNPPWTQQAESPRYLLHAPDLDSFTLNAPTPFGTGDEPDDFDA